MAQHIFFMYITKLYFCFKIYMVYGIWYMVYGIWYMVYFYFIKLHYILFFLFKNNHKNHDIDKYFESYTNILFLFYIYIY